MPPDTSHVLSVFDDSIVINFLIRSPIFQKTFFCILTEEKTLSDFFVHILFHAQTESCVLFHTRNDERVQCLLEYIIWEDLFKKSRSKIKEYLLMSAFCYMLRGTINNVELWSGSRTENKKIIQILRYITERYETVTLKETAEKFGYVPNYLSNLMSTEQTPIFAVAKNSSRQSKTGAKGHAESCADSAPQSTWQV